MRMTRNCFDGLESHSKKLGLSKSEIIHKLLDNFLSHNPLNKKEKKRCSLNKRASH